MMDSKHKIYCDSVQYNDTEDATNHAREMVATCFTSERQPEDIRRFLFLGELLYVASEPVILTF